MVCLDVGLLDRVDRPLDLHRAEIAEIDLG